MPKARISAGLQPWDGGDGGNQTLPRHYWDVALFSKSDNKNDNLTAIEKPHGCDYCTGDQSSVFER